jgi:hypothetical protein
MIIVDFGNGARAKGIICGHEFSAVYVLLYVSRSSFAQVWVQGMCNPFMGKTDAFCFG